MKIPTPGFRARLARGTEPARQDGPQPPVADEPGQTGAEAVLPLGPRSIRAAFQDLVGRPPFLAEREQWAGKALPALVFQLLATREFWEHWIAQQLYYFLLIRNFRPESPGVLSLPAELEARSLGVIDALHRIALSPAFDLRNPGADTFVTVVMEQLLGIEVQKQQRELEIGKALYDGERGLFLGHNGNSQSDVVRLAIEDKRCVRVLLAREHRRLVRSEPPSRELSRWSGELSKDRLAFPAIVREWFLSPAWLARLEARLPEDNRLFVRGLFVDLHDRLPSDEEWRPMVNALDGLSDSGPLRSVLARVLLDSGTVPLPKKEEVRDPTVWIAGLFERWLGRPAGEDELAAFAHAFRAPACRPETIAYALLSHPEYHRY